MPLIIGCPKVGLVGLSLSALSAPKLAMASKAPAEQRVKATKTRGLNRPDSEVEFFFMEIFPLLAAVEIVADNSKTPPRPDAFFSGHSKINHRNLRRSKCSSELLPSASKLYDENFEYQMFGHSAFPKDRLAPDEMSC